MKVLDLFSGIGGFSLGLERAGMKTVAFCEIDPFCQKVLRKHWKDVPIHSDIRELKGEHVGPVDLVAGGFPCQPFSTASRGRRLGVSDDRFLWPEMLRVISETRPTWVIGENVIGLKPVEVEQVVSDLGEEGFHSVVMEIPACATLKDHWRPRNWFLGYANGNGKSKRAVHEQVALMQRRNNGTGDARGSHGFSKGVDGFRKRALGNSVVPQVVELIGKAIMEASR